MIKTVNYKGQSYKARCGVEKDCQQLGTIFSQNKKSICGVKEHSLFFMVL